VCWQCGWLAVVRGRCCTPALYSQRADPLRAKEVAATGVPAAAQVNSLASGSLTDRQSLSMALLAGTAGTAV
jgi:hypothetical protein